MTSRLALLCYSSATATTRRFGVAANAPNRILGVTPTGWLSYRTAFHPSTMGSTTHCSFHSSSRLSDKVESITVRTVPPYLVLFMSILEDVLFLNNGWRMTLISSICLLYPPFIRSISSTREDKRLWDRGVSMDLVEPEYSMRNNSSSCNNNNRTNATKCSPWLTTSKASGRPCKN